ncbi:MAG: anaerobic ribonucleoside-triphosphate reductase activating protein [Candidatus Bathyarchaeia archaeon]
MIIKGLQKFTLIDYPGKLACTIFTFGCNFRCPYCQNPELIMDDGRKPISTAWILNFLYERKGFLDGICITGGEPTLHQDLLEFLHEVKQMGYLIKIDTNGSNPEVLKKAIKNGIIDYIAMDIKAPLKKYSEVVRVKVKEEEIKKSIEIIKNSGLDYEFRTTVVPDLLNKEDFNEIGKLLKGTKRFYLQQFQGKKTLDKNFEGKTPLEKKELEEIKKILSKYVNFCGIRGT